MKKTLLVLIALITCLSTAPANIKNVPGAYATIQAAINAASNGDTVLVDPGTYTENINFRTKNIVVTSKFFQTNDPATIWGTVIKGSNPVSPDSGSCVLIIGHQDSTAVLQGFAITNGTGTKWFDEHGAGLYREGGGILVALSSPVIQFNIIYNNDVTNTVGVSSTGGGGMRIGDCYARVYNNIVFHNTGHYGAGIVLNYTGGELKNNVICSNYGSNSYGAGSGLWINNTFSRPKLIENNTIVNNTASSGCGGIYSNGVVTTTTIRNNIVWGNTGTGANLQIQGGTTIVTYSDVQGGFTGSGNMNSDPVFADSNFYLAPSSPCIDKGDSSAIYNDPADLINPPAALYPSRGTLRNDMGAYGGPLTHVLTGQIIGIQQNGTTVPASYVLMQNYPNPFNPSTTIEFSVPKSESIVLVVYDINGRKVASLVNGFIQAGNYKYDFEASKFASGIYFYTLRASGFTETKRMLMIK